MNASIRSIDSVQSGQQFKIRSIHKRQKKMIDAGFGFGLGLNIADPNYF